MVTPWTPPPVRFFEDPPPPKPKLTFILGLDLAQSSDYTALVVLERALQPAPDDPSKQLGHYAARHLKRWPLKTSYLEICEEVVKLVATPPLEQPKLCVDITGVGAAVLDVLKKANPKALIRPVLITGGHEVSYQDGTWHTPKKELVGVMQVLLQAHRLKVAPVPERELLIRELLAFKVKVTINANETFEAWRQRDHDDLVLATAIAAWVGEREGGADVASAVVPLFCRRQGADDVHARYLGRAPGTGRPPPWRRY
jgi:hypothetical protein